MIAFFLLSFVLIIFDFFYLEEFFLSKLTKRTGSRPFFYSGCCNLVNK